MKKKIEELIEQYKAEAVDTLKLDKLDEEESWALEYSQGYIDGALDALETLLKYYNEHQNSTSR